MYKCVFKSFLKDSTETACLSDRGRAFHSKGARATKARSPRVTRCVVGGTKRARSADLRLRTGL